MNNFYRSAPSNFHSFVDWFALSGVSFEVGEITAYEAGMALRAEKEARIAGPEAIDTPVQKPKTAASKPATANISLPEFTSIDELNAFSKAFRDLGLCKTASSCVVGIGSLTPQLMVITDTPEDQEDRSGLAFSGLSNQMIQKALGFAGLEHANIYYTYLSKWRPPGKRALTPQEAELCAALLKQEIRLLRPQAILSLGESTLRAISPDSLTGGRKIPFINTNENQILDYKMPFFASQKSEFLVKNTLMKKNFWFSLLEFAATIRT